LPNTFTKQDWQRCLEWWNYSCAFCGKQRDFWNTIEVEHFIAISSPECPGTVVGNMLPACKSCNSSKSDRDAEIWLIGKFGKKRATEIVRRINEYFETLRDNDNPN
jgi:5-methylcytosine-specific restriction endonuclease McrA